MKETVKPNFLFIGPDKAGSSWLFEFLSRHPQCFVPSSKDIYFFDKEYHRGINWYLEFFKAAPGNARAIGELSHDYLFSPEAAHRIATDFPAMKLITSLRKPAERSYSHYLYLKRSGITRCCFSDAIKEIPEILNNSMYARHIGNYLEHFNDSQILFLKFDDLQNDPQYFADQVCRFLDIPTFLATDIGVVRAAAEPRSHSIAYLLRKFALGLRKLGNPKLVGKLKHSFIADWFYRPYNQQNRPSLTPEELAYLECYFKETINQTAELTGLNLDSWKVR